MPPRSTLPRVREALERCERYFVVRDKAAHWRVFEPRCVRAAAGPHTPPDHAMLARQHGFESAAAVGSALQVVRKRMLILMDQVSAEIDQPSLEDASLSG